MFWGFWILGFAGEQGVEVFGFLWNPLSWVMEATAIMAIALANGGVSAETYSFFLCLTAENSDKKRKENTT